MIPLSQAPHAEAGRLERMLINGLVRMLENREKENKGLLLVANIDEEFRAFWRVPFSVEQVGATDTISFLRKWDNVVEVFTAQCGTTYQQVVLLRPASRAWARAQPR